MNKAIITGASSGIGKALAEVLSENGYETGLMARRVDILNDIADGLPGPSYVRELDVSDTEKAINTINGLIEEMSGVDLIVLNAGTGHQNPELIWEKETPSIDVNVKGFTATANTAFNYFRDKGAGHIVGISSIAGLRGSRFAPSYNSSKAYISTYMDSLRHKSVKENLNITITDILPGFVDTKMAQGDNIFWMAPLKKAALQIFKAIIRKKKRAYITKRWRLVAWMIKILPDFIYNRI